jgi:hypothetical protein
MTSFRFVSVLRRGTPLFSTELRFVSRNFVASLPHFRNCLSLNAAEGGGFLRRTCFHAPLPRAMVSSGLVARPLRHRSKMIGYHVSRRQVMRVGWVGGHKREGTGVSFESWATSGFAREREGSAGDGGVPRSIPHAARTPPLPHKGREGGDAIRPGRLMPRAAAGSTRGNKRADPEWA